jgi:hypothetical protein
MVAKGEGVRNRSFAAPEKGQTRLRDTDARCADEAEFVNAAKCNDRLDSA